ncbi:class I SAM-dependent methyltransferase [Lacticigenium naphthae]|uniref:class I SAM-dependent methyltransferase n=1 Tax=Lacticigenium naphthae TaxID=515351 RepID=UPI000482B99C|nr:class I SAM-dependent methyltransferase [Lacticigenium naphthae]
MNCKICQSPTIEKVDPHHGTVFHECSACLFISRDSTAYISQEEEFQIYENHNNSIDDPRYVDFFMKFLTAAVFPYLKNDQRQALDFGSGPSPVLAQLMERDFEFLYTLYDKFYEPDPHYSNQKYDLITTTEVVEHIADPIPIFKELTSLLKEDGIFAVMTLFHKKDPEKFFGWHYMRDLSHVSFFTPEAMEIIAEKCGLQIIYCDNYRYTTFKKK